MTFIIIWWESFFSLHRVIDLVEHLWNCWDIFSHLFAMRASEIYFFLLLNELFSHRKTGAFRASANLHFSVHSRNFEKVEKIEFWEFSFTFHFLQLYGNFSVFTESLKPNNRKSCEKFFRSEVKSFYARAEVKCEV